MPWDFGVNAGPDLKVYDLGHLGLSYLRVLPHSSTPAILSKTRLRMRL
jgi:hypothetical protein